MAEQTIISARGLGKVYGGRSLGRIFLDALLGRRPEGVGRWVLRDVGFEIHRGETVGIVGRNGAGKSTLLQLLAGVLKPSEGSVETHGRIAAMLELGAGFDLEFTGRENIVLVASLLGLTREELDERLDDILAFADIGDFIDEPVRTYSSGMFVRLAFAINIHSSPDILIVDEALAVGDAAFQAKCFRKLRQIQEQGTTLLFVSHDVQSVRTLCQRAIWIKQGRLQADGPAAQVCAQYLRSVFATESGAPVSPVHVENSPDETESADLQGFCVDLSAVEVDRWGARGARALKVEIYSEAYLGANVFKRTARLGLRILAEATAPLSGSSLSLAFSIKHRKGLDLIVDTSYCHDWRYPDLSEGERFEASFDFDNILAPDEYVLVVAVEDRSEDTPRYLDFIEAALSFKVVSDEKVFSFVKPAVTLNARPAAAR
jgi:lipopolysaccharide transport system ATP-binding protein